jgi:diadenosine tetraphosphate (Ap4A) HIT family hydrolase
LVECPFCSLSPERIWLHTETTIAFRDAYPLSIGHTLVIPRRHRSAFFDLLEEEQLALWSEVSRVRRLIQEQFKPDGFNIGLNDGEASGQTVSHAHIHVIPRYRGDVPDPRGGIRWVIPSKAAYWSK